MRLYTLFFFVAFFVLGLSSGITGPALTHLVDRAEIPTEYGGLLLSLQTMGTIVSIWSIGYMLDRVNSRYIYWIAPTMLGVGTFALYAAPQGVISLIAPLLFGLGFGAMLVSGNVLVARMYANSPGSPLNLLNVFFGIGGIVGPQLANLARDQGNILTAFLWIATTAAFLVLPALKISIAPPYEKQAAAGTAPNRKLPMIVLLPFAAFMTLYTGAEIGFSSYLTTHLTETVGYIESNAASMVSVFWVGLTLGRVSGTILSQKMRDEWLLLLTTCIFFAGVVLLILSNNPTLIMASVLIVGFGAGPSFPTTIALMSNSYPSIAGSLSGTVVALGNIGIAVIPFMQSQIGGGGMSVIAFSTFILIGIALLLKNRIVPQTKEQPLAS